MGFVKYKWWDHAVNEVGDPFQHHKSLLQVVEIPPHGRNIGDERASDVHVVRSEIWVDRDYTKALGVESWRVRSRVVRPALE